MNDDIKKIELFYDAIAKRRDYWRKKNSYYHEQIIRLYKFLIPPNQNIVEIGCATGELLASLNPASGVGIDISQGMINIAKKKHPHLQFIKKNADHITLREKFNYIILSDIIGNLNDIQKSFEQLHKISTSDTRIIISYYNYLWEPLLRLGEKLGLKMPQPIQNWISDQDIKNFIELANLEAVKKSRFLLLPVYIPFFSNFVNKYIARLPFINKLCLVNYFIVRKKTELSTQKNYSVSIIIPARNEAGNIEEAIKRIPEIGKKTEIIFIEGHSRDNTKSEILSLIKKYKKRKIIFVDQSKGIGKADAVRKGIAKASGEIIIIFDADLTVDPDELPKFYSVIQNNKAEYIHGSRLIYPMENQAMRLLNILGNKFFSAAFTFLLDQRIKDTLCGTKVIFRKDYEKIAQNRSYFGDFDPFGDFDLIFGASKLNLKILEIPIRYKARSYGTTNISRFRHGLLLMKMTIIAARKIKFF